MAAAAWSSYVTEVVFPALWGYPTVYAPPIGSEEWSGRAPDAVSPSQRRGKFKCMSVIVFLLPGISCVRGFNVQTMPCFDEHSSVSLTLAAKFTSLLLRPL